MKINDIKEQSVSLYHLDSGYIGEIESILSFYDVRLQIKRQALTGFYITYNGIIFDIYSDGKVDANFNGFDFLDKALCELI